MNVVSIQVILFLKNIIARPDFLAEEINQKMNNLFDAMPTCIDLPPNAPAEIPMVFRKSTNSSHTLNISRMKCELTFSPTIDDNQLSTIHKKYSEYINSYINAAILNHEIVRIGIIYTVFKSCDNPCEYISHNYFNDSLINKDELSLRLNKVTTIDEIKINNVFSISDVIAKINEKDKRGVLITRDTNNVPDVSNTPLTFKQISSILSHSYSKLDDSIFMEE